MVALPILRESIISLSSVNKIRYRKRKEDIAFFRPRGMKGNFAVVGFMSVTLGTEVPVEHRE